MIGPQTYDEGRPSWVDLATPDPAGAKEFYRNLFGWDYEVQPGSGEDGYSMARIEGHAVAGIARSPDPDSPATWTTYLSVADAAATAARVGAAGGTVLVQPMVVGPAGTMAYLRDPGGAAVGVWQGAAHTGAARINEPGAFSWSELHTSDTETATAFYNAVFGLKSEPIDTGGRPAAVFKAGDLTVAATMPGGSPELSSRWRVYFGAVDVDAACDAAAAAGGAVLSAPHEGPIGRVATVRDEQGAVFSMITPPQWPE